MRLLIVDDEKNTRNVLRNFIPWQELGIEEIREAKNGKEALSIAEEFAPDIVLSDIRMPMMNGLEFAKNYRLKDENTRFIFLSAYSDREYLKEAIKLRAISYVEKPINIAEIKEAVLSATNEIKKLKLHTENQKEFIQKQVVMELTLENFNVKNFDSYIEKHNFFKYSISSYSVSYIRLFPTDESIGAEYTYEELDSKFEMIIKEFIINNRQIDEKRLKIFLENHFLYASKDLEHIICHARFDNLFSYKDFLAMHKFIQEKLPASFHRVRKALIGIGNTVSDITLLSKSYQLAKKARKMSFISSNVEDLSSEIKTFNITALLIKESSNMLKQADKIEILDYIEKLKNDILHCLGTTEESVRSLYIQLFLALSKRAEYHNKTLFVNMKNAYLTALSEACCLDELHALLKDAIHFYFISSSADNMSNISNKVTAYILENYSKENLSISMIASNMYLSPNYLSLMFKQETGKTINQFITETRIERAKELLKNEKLTLSNISLKVGYHDANYFSKAFKRETGISPKAYRENL